MTLISKLKSLLGLNAGRYDGGGTTVTVEREPRTETERAVKESPGPSATSDEPEEADAASAIEEAEPGASDEPVQHLSGIGPAYAEQLADAGIETVGDLAAADAAELASATDLGEGRLSGWIEQAKDA
jgi:predicted flap endonuclease-1-like 5' DNA nuclease